LSDLVTIGDIKVKLKSHGVPAATNYKSWNQTQKWREGYEF